MAADGTVAPMLTLTGSDEVRAHVGRELGVSEWHRVTQADVDAFADVTGDHQWIHVDPERGASTPFGGTIAHGFFTLALAPRFTYRMWTVEGFAYGLNYGLNRVRFPAPMPVGERVRLHAKLLSADEVPGGLQLVCELTFEREGGERPVCVAETVTRVYSG
jgi:acyl dehydratase